MSDSVKKNSENEEEGKYNNNKEVKREGFTLEDGFGIMNAYGLEYEVYISSIKIAQTNPRMDIVSILYMALLEWDCI